MTPEEANVINLAIELRRQIPGRDTIQRIALEAATWELVTKCEQCNHDTHTCPGCGAWVPHAGDGVCNECRTTYADECRCSADEKMYCASSQCHGGSNVQESETQWVLRTWQDVRTDDRVRMPGTDVTATIQTRYLSAEQDPMGQAWHVVSGGSGPFAHQKDHVVQPGECVVLLEGETQPRFMNPVAPVEIEVTAKDVWATELLGWENRR
jgi:hypothetical protein